MFGYVRVLVRIISRIVFGGSGAVVKKKDEKFVTICVVVVTPNLTANNIFGYNRSFYPKSSECDEAAVCWGVRITEVLPDGYPVMYVQKGAYAHADDARSFAISQRQFIARVSLKISPFFQK